MSGDEKSHSLTKSSFLHVPAIDYWLLVKCVDLLIVDSHSVLQGIVLEMTL